MTDDTLESPDLLVGDIRTFFRGARKNG